MNVKDLDKFHCWVNSHPELEIRNNRFGLTAHNWQKWTSIFLTCPCYKIYRVEAVDLKSSNYSLKIMIFVNMWNLGNFLKIWYFVNNCLIKSLNLKTLLHKCDTYNCDYLPHTIFHFYPIELQLNTDFPPQFEFFSLKSPSVTQRWVSQETLLKRVKTCHLFFVKLSTQITVLL